MNSILIAGCLGIALLALMANGYADDALPPPDIVVYLADDLSAADLTLYGGTNIKTPAIDELAAEGLTFNRAFVASPSCAPCRAQMTLQRLSSELKNS